MTSRLPSLMNAIGAPRNYFHGRSHAEACIPNNIVIFRRTSGADLRRATFEMRPHHRFVLIFNFATAGTVRIDRADTVLRPGEGLLILPYQFHAFPKCQREQILWLIITFECDRPAMLNSFRGESFPFDSAIRRRLASILELYAARQQESSNQVLALEIGCLLAQLRPLLRKFSSTVLPADRRSQQLVEDVEEYLRQSKAAAIRISDLARHLHISESRLRARFRAAFGSSLGEFLRNYRLHLVIDQMRDGGRNFTEIANGLGFSDSASFTRFVRGQTGYTPGEFRRRMVE